MKKLFLLVFSVLFIGLVVKIADERLEVNRLKNVSLVTDASSPIILISAEDAVFELQLYNNNSAKQLLKQMPQTVVMTRWGEGSYGGSLVEKIDTASDKEYQRRAFFKGEVVLHQRENTLFLMFGPTPVGVTVDAPMLLASGGVPVGRLKEYSELEQLSGVVEFSFRIKK